MGDEGSRREESVLPTQVDIGSIVELLPLLSYEQRRPYLGDCLW
jgi:hypothetical protein